MAKKTEADAPGTAKGGVGLPGMLALCGLSGSASFAGAYLFMPVAAELAVTDCASEPASVYNRDGLITDDFAFVPLDALTISVGGGDASRFVKIQLSIIAPADKTRVVQDAQPLLLDMFSDYLRAVEPQDFEDPDFYPTMKQQLARRAEIALGSTGSHGILVTEFLLR